MLRPTFVALCAIGASVLLAPLAAAQTTVTYQGRFDNAGEPYNGMMDVIFRVFDAAVGGAQIGPTTVVAGVSVDGGVFTAEFQYDRDGTAESPRFLEIEVLPDGEAAFLTLSPRSPIRPAPEAGQTQAARLQPNGDTEIGPDGGAVLADAYNTFVNGVGKRSTATEHRQRFISKATGPVQGVFGEFNTLPGSAINIEADIIEFATGDLIASGSIRNSTTTETSIPISQALAPLLPGTEYELVIKSFDNATRQPVSMTIEIDENNADPEGSYNGSAVEDLFGRITVAENTTSMVVTNAGTVIASNGLVVGPIGGQDGSVILPEASVNPEEMLAEPGVEFSGQDPNVLDDELARAELLAPADGFVHAIATANTETQSDSELLNDTAVVLSLVEDTLGIQDSALISLQAVGRATLQAVFPVTQGQTIGVSLLKDTEFFGNASNGRIVLVFYPTRYSVSP